MTDHVYEVWRIQNVECAPFSEIMLPTNEPIKTNHTIKARTQKEAEYKLRRRFKNAGFHLMGLIVHPQAYYAGTQDSINDYNAEEQA